MFIGIGMPLRSGSAERTPRPLMNLLTNTIWAGGGAAPTGYTQPVATGTSAPNGTVGPNVVYRQTAVSQRPFLQGQGRALGTSGSLTASLFVGEIYSGACQVQGLVAWGGVPGSAVLTYFVDGVAASATDLAVANTRIVCVITAGGFGGSPTPRFGIGTLSPFTADLDISRPQVETGAVATSYQWVDTVSNYDAWW